MEKLIIISTILSIIDTILSIKKQMTEPKTKSQKIKKSKTKN